MPEIYPAVFCIDPYTGIVQYPFSGLCHAPRQPHLMPAGGDLLTCVGIFNQVNRRVFNHSQCTPYELPNLIPATL